ncbi:MAG: AAA family ATPase [Oscillospiraceae bacterium]|nr:AAA family ATPase [Oscillospiraceae bacterium]MBQ7000278.1 AAA family ATPase [Oscillospiraceae bacterium]
MKILSMQATFGKLENETITFAPGLNVIHAPNEWGKSTWCAFIAAMLYGIDTRERNTQTNLADKERYAPWSGKPMSGRMELEWKGKNITIERSTKGRSIFGVFNAYETQSGLPIPELTADNCGLMLLGVEKSVFVKSAFIRQNDLQVTQDEALRRRLNALVTTGDESGASDRLAQKLKELKNACRHNKTGLLPQAEAQRTQTAGKLEQLRSFRQQAAQFTLQIADLDQQIADLENHRLALAYAAAQEDLQRVQQAQVQAQVAAQKQQTLTAACAGLPTPAEAAQALQQLDLLQEEMNQMQREDTPTLPDPPAQKAPFHGLDVQQTQEMVERDLWQYQALNNKKQYIPYWISFFVGLIVAVIFARIPQLQSWCLVPLLICGLPLVIKRLPHIDDRKHRIELEHKYASGDPSLWQAAANAHIQALDAHAKAMAQYEDARNLRRQQQTDWEQKVMALTQGAPISSARKYWEQVRLQHQQLEEAKATAARAQNHAQELSSMIRTAQPHPHPDKLSYSLPETETRAQAASLRRQQLQQMLGQAQGQAEALGSEAQLEKELDTLDRRINKLENTYGALVLAQQTLETAAQELQRQFAPRISKRAAQLFEKLTDGRYDRLALDQDLTLSAGTREEDTLRKWQWRSDGTADQLYLALRLAVAEELTPQSPIILDDALVRFDDNRAKTALQILKDTGIHRQVILFSCQNREKTWEIG